MKTTKTALKLAFLGVLGLGSLALPKANAASPDRLAVGQVVTAKQLGAANHAQLAKLISEARRTDPQAFTALADIKGYRPIGYMQTRARRPTVNRELTALGARGLLPMLDALVNGLPNAPKAVANEERMALEIGLLEAVGRLGTSSDKELVRPVLEAAFKSSGAGPLVSAAALGLGRMCIAPAQSPLEPFVSGLAGDEMHQSFAVRALGECRDGAVVARLVSLVATGKHVAKAAEALGVAANAWALDAMVRSGTMNPESAERIRQSALSVLRARFALGKSGEVDALSHAISLVGNK